MLLLIKQKLWVFIVFIIIVSVFYLILQKKNYYQWKIEVLILVIGFTDEGSSFEYTQEKAQEVEKD